MTPSQLSDAVLGALDGLVRRGVVALDGELPGAVRVERPRPGGVGDYATGAALQLADRTDLTAARLAELLAQELAAVPGIDVATATGPGFVNLSLARAALAELLAGIVAAGPAYGRAVRAEELSTSIDAALRRAVATGGPGLLDLYGHDTLRYAVARSASGTVTPADTATLALADDRNPAYRVRYVHSRCTALLRNAADLAIEPIGGGALSSGLLDPSVTGGLARRLADYPGEVAAAVRHREPPRVARFLEEVAERFLEFCGSYRVLPQGDEDATDVHRGRLLVVDATRVVIGNGLHLLGVGAPARV